jgi:large subunit ribosomal protein L9
MLEQKGYSIDRRKIVLEHPIKQLGEHKVGVKLHREVTVEVTVNVVKDEEPAA